jgi:hypothetical protein
MSDSEELGMRQPEAEAHSSMVRAAADLPSDQGQAGHRSKKAKCPARNRRRVLLLPSGRRKRTNLDPCSNAPLGIHN